MPSTKRNTAKPEGDNFWVRDDGTVDIRSRGEMHYLRCPTVDEMQKFAQLHYQLLRDVNEGAGEMAEIQQRLFGRINDAVATTDETEPSDVPDVIDVPVSPDEEQITADGERVQELLARQRTLVADFWAVHVIPTLADPEWKVSAGNLPAFFAHPGSVGRLINGWYSLPPVPGGG